MNRFFVPNKIYKERISTCKKCKFYFKLTGQCKKCLCFMKVKARLAPMECPEKYWLKTKEMKAPEDLPKEIINEVLLIWEDIKTGKAKNHEVKAQMIELYNTIYGSNYSTGTNCGSCLSTCFDGIQKLYKKYKPKDQFYEV